MVAKKSASPSTCRQTNGRTVSLTRRRALFALGATSLLTAFASLESGCAAFSSLKPVDAAITNRAAESASRDATRELERLATLHKDGRPSVCFIGVSGGPEAASLSDATRERLGEIKSVKFFEKTAVQAALKESGVSANNVFIPSEREKFVDALGESVDYLLAGYVETRELDGEESGGKEKMKRVYKLELVELETSKKCEFVADL